MDSDLILRWAPIFIAVITAAGSAIAWWSGRGKRAADVSAINTEISLKLLNEMQEEIKREKDERRELISRVVALETAIAERDTRIGELEKKLFEEQELRRDLESRFALLEKERDQLKAENIRLKHRKDGLS